VNGLMGSLVIEPLTIADVDEVLALEEAAFTNPWTRAMYLAELENKDVSYCFLARDARRHAVGFCSFWRVLDELHINNLAVLPELRRTGIGSTLLAFVLHKGVELGANPRDGVRALRIARLRHSLRRHSLLLERRRDLVPLLEAVADTALPRQYLEIHSTHGRFAMALEAILFERRRRARRSGISPPRGAHKPRGNDPAGDEH